MYKIRKNLRNGKYRKYEKKILQYLVTAERYDNVITSAAHIFLSTKIPKSSLYDVLGKLRHYSYIDWMGEPRDWLSMIDITEKGKAYLKEITDKD